VRNVGVSEIVKQIKSTQSRRELMPRERMSWLLEHERARTDRTGREFAIAIFHVVGENGHAAIGQRLASAVMNRVRATDEVGWYDEHRIAAILPETTKAGAQCFVHDVCARVSDKEPPYSYCKIYCYPSTWIDESSDHRGNGNGNGNGHSGNGHSGNGKAHEPPVAVRGAAIRVDRLEELVAHPLPMWKRVIDVAIALVGLMLASPVMLLVALLVKVSSPGPVIFKQKRAGRGGVPFTIYKFRTMVDGADQKQRDLRKMSEQDGPAFKMKNDPRLTGVGRFLRNTSLDELPQLWNVVKGDMSLVGPRPLPVHEADACHPWQRRRLTVTPGITCIWQVNGRSRVAFSEWMRMDLAYIQRRTFVQDVKILLQTFPAVVRGRGAH
jgi:lipopolysaccharide/colanic/teichoic acid biosynthesis glycosyltransferase